MLFTQWQDGVTRKDMVETFSFQDFMEVQNLYQIRYLQIPRGSNMGRVGNG